MSQSRLEALVRALTVCSFVLMCWVFHRTLSADRACVASRAIASVGIAHQTFDNCRYESRLSLNDLRVNLEPQDRSALRALAAADVADLDMRQIPNLRVEISEAPREFRVSAGRLVLGRAWLGEPLHVRRALLMARVKARLPASADAFQLEVLTDFELLARGLDLPTANGTSLSRDVKFSTAATELTTYCRSPFRSLAHETVCSDPKALESVAQAQTFGLRPLLAAGLWRVWSKLDLTSRLKSLKQLELGLVMPPTEVPPRGEAGALVLWYQRMLNAYAEKLQLASAPDYEHAFKRTLGELEIEAPTHWELTIDLRNTPVWKEILTQLKERSRFRKQERTLVFTPDGETALPSGLPVAWAAADIQSQKHVTIACNWPAEGDAVHVRAGQIFAHQSCEKLKSAFWD